jgi:formyltetrahydrofolate synthetase
MEALRTEFDYYLAHQNELVKKYNGKFIVIKNQAVIGDYESELEAVKKTAQEHELGTFLVQKCEPGSESYTQMYHSRVTFV